jgi:hypothetical protein
VVAFAAVLALAWLRHAHTLGSFIGEGYPDLSVLTTVRASFGLTDERLVQMVGKLGWVDTPVPFAVVAGWALLLGALVVPALAGGRLRRSLTLASLMVAVVLLPVVSEAMQQKKFGFIWQGRYSLPLAVGVPLLAAWILASAPPDLRRQRRTLVLVAGAWIGLQLLTHAASMRRYLAGIGSSTTVAYWQASGWAPPLPALALTALFVATVGGLAACIVVAVWPTGADPP